MQTYLKYLERSFNMVVAESVARIHNRRFNYDKWDKQVFKLFKALSLMEKFKTNGPFFS